MWNFNVVGRGALRLLLLVYILAILPDVNKVAADENNQKPPKSASLKRRSYDSYCGLYCLYTVIKLAGQEVDFQELVKPEYRGSNRGSSLAELKKVAEDYGLYALPADKLTSRELGQLAYPIILHVKTEIGSKQYDHYELLLGTESSKARIFNPPEPVRLVPFWELAPRWDGNGLIVSAEPIDLVAVSAPARKRFIMYAAIALVIILIVHRAKRWLPEAMLNSRGKLFGLSMTQGAVFAIASLLCGMFYHFVNDEGLLANANATSSIQQAHLGNFIPKVSEKKVQELLDSDTVFIDARFERDFEAGHLEGAISVPVNTTDEERQMKTANIPKDARIVLYCQSAGCKYAEKVAIRLLDDDFSNISIFKGGWQEWAAKNGREKEK